MQFVAVKAKIWRNNKRSSFFMKHGVLFNVVNYNASNDTRHARDRNTVMTVATAPAAVLTIWDTWFSTITLNIGQLCHRSAVGIVGTNQPPAVPVNTDNQPQMIILHIINSTSPTRPIVLDMLLLSISARFFRAVAIMREASKNITRKVDRPIRVMQKSISPNH